MRKGLIAFFVVLFCASCEKSILNENDYAKPEADVKAKGYVLSHITRTYSPNWSVYRNEWHDDYQYEKNNFPTSIVFNGNTYQASSAEWICSNATYQAWARCGQYSMNVSDGACGTTINGGCRGCVWYSSCGSETEYNDIRQKLKLKVTYIY